VLAVALVPQPPLHVPALAGTAAAEVAPLLRACEEAVALLAAEAPETVVILGGGARTARHRSTAWGTLAGYGVAVEAPARHREEPSTLPLSLTLGRWLLERVRWRGAVALQEVDAAAPAAQCLDLGRRLAASVGRRTCWLVVADGSARRGTFSPGYDDSRAVPFDAGVARALDSGDVAALAALDPVLARELMAAGRAPWQVLAGAVGEQRVARARLSYDAAPFGVGYFVASWFAGGPLGEHSDAESAEHGALGG
jgi:hypothetical protein